MKRPLSILIVDDDATHRNMLQTLLQEWGYVSQEAEDGDIAVELCKEKSFDLVLMDVRMPKKTGLEALKEIQTYNPALPVLIMTAFSDVEAAVEAIKSGAYDYLTKPFTKERLADTLDRLIEKRKRRLFVPVTSGREILGARLQSQQPGVLF